MKNYHMGQMLEAFVLNAIDPFVCSSNDLPEAHFDKINSPIY